MRLLLVVALLGGCRFDFDAVTPGDGAIGAIPDALPPVTVACNTGVHVADAATAVPRLSTTLVGAGLLAAWIEADATIGVANVRIPAVDQITPTATTHPWGGGWRAVTLASNGVTVISVATSQATSQSDIQIYSATTLAPIGTARTVMDQVFGGRSAVAINATPVNYGLLATTTDGVECEMVPISANGIPGAALPAGPPSVLSSLYVVESELVQVVVDASGINEVTAVNTQFSQLGAPVEWGNGNASASAVAAHGETRADLLLLREDAVDLDLDYAIATITGMTFVVPTETALALGATSPRAVAVSTGYWVTFHQAGQLVAQHLTFAAAVDATHMLGPRGDPSGHDLVLVGGEPYEVWISGTQVLVAHLCI